MCRILSKQLRISPLSSIPANAPAEELNLLHIHASSANLTDTIYKKLSFLQIVANNYT